MYTLVVLTDNTSVIIIIITTFFCAKFVFGGHWYGKFEDSSVVLEEGMSPPSCLTSLDIRFEWAQLADLGVTPCECWAKNMFSLIEQKQEVAIFRDLQGSC